MVGAKGPPAFLKEPQSESHRFRACSPVNSAENGLHECKKCNHEMGCVFATSGELSLIVFPSDLFRISKNPQIPCVVCSAA